MNRTIAAISTGQAPGGIGVVRISGPEAFSIADQVFQAKSGKKLGELSGYQAAMGGIFDSAGEKLDDCVALVFRAPKSYTGEDVVELSCHGGLYITRLVLEEVLSAGALPAGRGEFTRRAFLNGKLDLAQAESVMELIGAQGRQAARLALAGTGGILSKKLDGLIEELKTLASHLAAWADFPEEDVEEVTGQEMEEVLGRVEASLQHLLAGFEKGRMYREGLRTVIAGRPNVGKSTLMNLLAGRERSIVTPYPGTTRDVVEESVSLAGVPLLLADTAGLRSTSDPVEEIGVAAARQRVRSAQLVLAVFDSSRELDREDRELMESLRDVPAIAVVNKIDLPCLLDVDLIRSRFPHYVELSAGQGKGAEDLEAALACLLGTENFEPGDGGLFTQRQRSAAARALDGVKQGKEALSLGMTLDAVTVCVEDSLSALYELTGQRVSDEIVNQVFEQFCVGK